MNYLMLFPTPGVEEGHVLWVDDKMVDADEQAKSADALRDWIDTVISEHDMKYSLRSLSALANMHMQTGSMLLYMPKQSQVDTTDDWIANMFKELNEENVMGQDLKMIVINTTVE